MSVDRVGRIAAFLRCMFVLLLVGAGGAYAQPLQKCDVNGDAIIDQTDINLILAARNLPATGADDPRDPDNNGIINLLDVRTCQQRCTRAACSTVNTAPTAHAGPDQSLTVGAVAVLSGAASTDVDGPNPLTYAWTLTNKPAGSTASLVNANTVAPSFTIDRAGTYRISLVVFDGLASSAADEVVVSTLNSAPTANAGPDQTKQVGQLVTLAGSGSDPDGNPLTFAWTLTIKPGGSTATLSNPTSAGPTFTIDKPGSYTAQLVVNDGLVNSTPDTVVITTQNSAPVANAGPDQSVFVGSTATLSGAASTDVDGDPLTFAWTLLTRPAGSAAVLSNPSAIAPTFVADVPGNFVAQLVVNDGTVNSAPDTVTISTGNTAPVANPRASCAASPNVDCSAAVGSLIGLDGSASTDVDGNPLTYAWSLAGKPPGSAAVITNPTAVNASFTTDVPGDFIVQLIVNDGFVASVPKTVKVTSTNVKPTAVATIAPQSIPGVPTLMQLSGAGSTDPEGQGLTFAWSLIAKPAGSTAVLSSAIAVNPTFTADKLGTYTAQLIVNDGFLSSTPATATASTSNQPPTANAGPDQNVTAGATVQLTSAGSSDPEGAPLGYFWSLLSKPAGSTADFAPSANSATPTFVADKKGTYVVQLIVNDGTLDSAPDTVQINAGNRPPVAVPDTFGTQEDTTLVVGAGVGVLANDSDPDGDPLTAAIVGATPAGLTFSANGGFTYTPPANFSGPTTFQYKANDGTADSNTVTVTINVSPVNDPPTANAGPLQNVNVGATVQLDGSASSDPEGAVLTYAWTLPTRPAGSVAAIVNPTSVNPTFVADVAGTFVAQLIVNDGSLPSAPSTVTIVATSNLPVVTVAATTPTATEAGPANGVFTFTRTGSTAAALTLQVARTGTATNNVDYQNLSVPIVIPIGQASVTVTVTPIKDNLTEGDETVILTITANAAYSVGAQGAATVTIVDDPAIVQVTASTPAANEQGPVNGAFTFTRAGGDLAAPLTIQLTRTGTATNNVDYQNLAIPVVIPAAQTSVAVPVVPIPDNLVEGSETVVLTIVANAAYTIGASGAATVTIADSAPVVQVTASTPTATEAGPANGVFTISRTGGDLTAPLTVQMTRTGTATNNVDYQNLAVPIAIPATQASVTVPVIPIKDNLTEGGETVILTITANASYTIGASATATVTITDDPAIVQVTASTPAASEAGPVNGAFTFTRSGGDLTAPLTVQVSRTGSATNNVDYQNLVVPVLIPAGQASLVVPVVPIKDNLAEGGETVILTIVSNATYTIGASGAATVTIADDPAIVQVTASTPTASETGPVNGAFTFTRTGGDVAAPLTVQLTRTGTATNNVDYQNLAIPIVIPAAQTSLVVPVVPLPDGLVEGDETVILTIVANAAYTIGASGAATVTISDSAASTADVQIAKTVFSNPTPTVGETVTFQVNATNAGPGTATGVVVQDLLPSGYAYVSKAVLAGTYNEATGVWTIGSINNGSTATLRVVATALATGNYTNTATRTASTSTDPNAANDSSSITVTPFASADVQIVKTVFTNPTPTVGENVTFQIAATNAGPGNALGVVVQDLLPSGYAFVSKTIFNGSYNEATGVWTIGTINSGATATIRVTATALASGSYTNTATKTASSPTDPNTANDTSSVTVTPVAGADVQVVKTVFTNPTPTVGESVTFQIVATNAGPGNATGVVVQDLLPSGYQFVSKVVFQGAYNEATGVWGAGTINNGASATLRVTATALASGSYTNTATRTASTPTDPNAANDTSSVTVAPATTADVQVVKSVFTNPAPTIGENVTFQIVATNNGPGNALGVVVQDLLPTGYQFVSKVVFNGTYNEATGVWNAGNIGNGGNATLRVTATALATGNYTNTATRTASSPPDPNTANDASSITVTPSTGADVQIVKTVFTNPTPTIGENVTFQIVATNNGPGNALGVVVQDLLPSGYQFVSKQVFQGTYNEATGVWTVGTVNNGANATLRVTATALATGSYTNTATRTASTPTDTNAANDTSSVTATPSTGADVQIVKTVFTNPTPTIGENVTFQIVATNNGPGNALGVVVQDLLPSGYQYVSKQVFQGTYNEATGVWTVGTVNNGANATLRVTATALASGSYTNTATRTASTPTDTNAANDTSSVTATPAATADVQIVKTLFTNPTPTIGENVTFQIVATNNGPGNALGVVVQDLLPSGYQFVSKQVFQGTYNEATGVWTVGTVNNGANATLRVTATALASGSYTNTASRTASSPPDPNAANDTSSVTATPAATADVQIVKTLFTNPTPTIGENVTFQVVATNNGPGNALGVVVQDLLPSGYQFVSKQVFQGTYNEATGVWTVGTVNNGANATLRVTATALASGSYTNTATRTASTPTDSNAANDTSSVTATPAATADVQVVKTVFANPTPTIGENVTFQIVATNNGPGNALGVVVQDLLPSGYQFVSKQVFQGTYNEATGVWTVGTVNNGANATLRVTATALASGSYTNTASRTASSPPDPNAANDTSSVTATPAATADVQVVKTVFANPTPTIGENVTFQIVATNNGPGNALGVVVQDLLPSGYQFVSKQVFQGTYNEATGVWTVGTVNNGANATLRVTATALASGSYTNTASRTASSPPDPNAANDTSSVTPTPAATADVQIVKTVFANPTPTVGENVTFQVVATNNGPGNALGVVVQDLLPSGYQFVSKVVFNGSYNEATGVWTVGTINNGTTATLRVTATALATGSYANTASRTASSPTDPNAANDTSTVTPTPFSTADVQVTKTVFTNPNPSIGQNVTFQIVASNAGPGNALGVVVQDLLPTGYVYVSKLVFNGSYNETTGVWTIGTVNNGTSATLRVTATAQAAGSFTNTATKTASSPTDPNAANNTSAVTVTPIGALAGRQ